LVKHYPASVAAQGIIGKFQRPFEGPSTTRKIINPTLFELCDEEGSLQGLDNLQHLKPYLRATDEIEPTDVLINTGMSIAESRKRSKAKFG
jgi:hypothetical protein